MKFKTYNEFVSWFNILSIYSKVAAFNRYWENIDYDKCIHPMVRFNDFFDGYTHLDIASLVENNNVFTTNDEYFVLTYLDELISYNVVEAIEYMKEKLREQFDSEGEIEI